MSVHPLMNDRAVARVVTGACQRGTEARATGMLLNALASLELVRKEGAVFHNAPVAARFLAAGSPDSARMAMLHTARLWHRWSGLTECVRTGTAAPDESKIWPRISATATA